MYIQSARNPAWVIRSASEELGTESLYFCGLVNDAVSSSECTVSDDRIINELGRI